MELDTDAVKRGQAYIEHVGVKGMRWGVRRSSSAKRAAARSKALGPGHDDHKLSRELSKKKLRNMSNDEIRKLNERLSLEQQYVRLNPSKATRRQAKVEKTLKQLELAGKVLNAAAKTPQGKYHVEKGKEYMAKKATNYAANKTLRAYGYPTSR